MANAGEDILAAFVLIGLGVVGMYAFGYIIGFFFLVVLGLIAVFCAIVFFGFMGAVVNETAKHSSNIKREYDYAIRQNGGSIDGARMKFGDAEIKVEGPRNSFWKGMKYLFTGEEEYSTKLKIGGHEVGKVKFNSNGGFKFKFQ